MESMKKALFPLREPCIKLADRKIKLASKAVGRFRCQRLMIADGKKV